MTPAAEIPLESAIRIDRILETGELPDLVPFIEELWPICRSITGPGVRDTLDRIGDRMGKAVPLERYHVKSGTGVFDWTVPPEWRIRDAFVCDEDGTRIVDFQRNNLHVVGYSEPVDAVLSLEELQERLFSIPTMPDAIPYITSYYRRTWGFCLSDRQRQALKPGRYRCVIDSDLDPNGQLDFAQAHLRGALPDEVFFSSYVCHPSMANNELSGPVVQAALLSILADLPARRLSYRAAFTTETIGTLCFLDTVYKHVRSPAAGGCVVTCVGDDGPFTYVRSLQGDSMGDRIFQHVLRHSHDGHPVDVRDFHPIGSDERQYCSPGFNLPVGSFSRSRFEDFPQYHTSLDDLSVVTEAGLQRSLRVLLRACQAFEMNIVPVRTNPFGEPQLGRRGLYSSDRTSMSDWTERIVFLCAFADGKRTMVEIAERAGRPVWSFLAPLCRLLEAEVLAVA